VSSSIVFEVELLIKKKSRKIVSQANSVTHLETRKKTKEKTNKSKNKKQKQNKKQNHIKYIRFSMYFFSLLSMDVVAIASFCAHLL